VEICETLDDFHAGLYDGIEQDLQNCLEAAREVLDLPGLEERHHILMTTNKSKLREHKRRGQGHFAGTA
jgi:hypothetical protein